MKQEMCACVAECVLFWNYSWNWKHFLSCVLFFAVASFLILQKKNGWKMLKTWKLFHTTTKMLCTVRKMSHHLLAERKQQRQRNSTVYDRHRVFILRKNNASSSLFYLFVFVCLFVRSFDENRLCSLFFYRACTMCECWEHAAKFSLFLSTDLLSVIAFTWIYHPLIRCPRHQLSLQTWASRWISKTRILACSLTGFFSLSRAW